MGRMEEKNASHYEARNKIISDLGFADYQSYLSSEIWMEIRRNVYLIHGCSCVLCGKHATQIHHHKYTLRNLSGKSYRCLYPMCSDCHKEIEFNPDGSKRTLESTKRAFNSRKAAIPEIGIRRRKEQRKWKKIRSRLSTSQQISTQAPSQPPCARQDQWLT